MNLLKPLTTPEYFFRPRQIVHRFRRALRREPLGEFETVTLPWGAPIRVRPREVIGSNIWCYGLFDMLVSEAICRLLDPSEVAVDIGANIGQMTNLMRHRTGTGGRVISFEPHPELFAELSYNINELPAHSGSAKVTLHEMALSDRNGQAFLDVGSLWAVNRGLAKLVPASSKSSPGTVAVKMAPLDEILEPGIKVGVCKIDVEGHELAVFKGAKRILGARGIRDIVFEDFNPYPSAVHKHLLEYGYAIFSLHSSLMRARLLPADCGKSFNEVKDGKNYIATLDPTRVTDRFKPPGWQSLR